MHKIWDTVPFERAQRERRARLDQRQAQQRALSEAMEVIAEAIRAVVDPLAKDLLREPDARLFIALETDERDAESFFLVLTNAGIQFRSPQVTDDDLPF
jgi:hypothetical protein